MKGTKGESQLLLLRNGFQKGKAFTKRFLFKKVGNIGVLTQVYLELDPPTDQWRYSTLSIIDIHGFEFLFGSKVLHSNTPSLWLKSFFLIFFPLSLSLFSILKKKKKKSKCHQLMK